MFTIVINSQKGGSGKTALCRLLSVEAARSHPDKVASVFLIDTDTQRTLSQWHEAREAEEPRRVDCPVEALGAGLGELEKHGAKFVFIDTPPQASENLDPVFLLADLVVIPIKPTSDDLKAAAVTVNRLKALDVPFLFVVTQAIQNTNITAQAVAALSHHGPVAETIIVNRVIYPAAFTDGRTPQEIEPRGRAARETAELWKFIQKHITARPIQTNQERSRAHG
ncbi:MAG: ParA family protein [candidate division Zixibacteria bacterium]|nr:ParA family protein [candidate division Zixibacteria bacterium]